MAKDNRVHLPSSGGGIVRYSEEPQSLFLLSPTVVFVLIAVVILVEIFLYKGFFG